MDRLFGRELSNLLHPQPINNHVHSKIPSKSTREPAISLKEGLKRPEPRSTSVHNDGKQPNCNDNEAKEDMSAHRNVQLVPEYFDDCLGFMLSQEDKTYSLTNYFRDQTVVNEKMRGILIDWIAELHYKYKMFPQTLYATAMMIDIYLSKKTMKKQNLQLLGAAAFFTAAKYEETYQVPELDDLVHFSAKAFTKQQIIKMEADLIQTLEFNLIMPTSYRFFEPLAKISGMDTKNFYLAQYVLELSLLDPKFLEYKPSVLASSAIYLINKIRKRSQSWPDILLAATSYEEKELKICARELCYLLERADQLPHTKSLKRKFSSAQYLEAARIKLERKRT